MSPRSSARAAAQTRVRIVRAAVDRASVSGLGGVALRDLANDLGMSKSGVVAPFGAREQLLQEAFRSAVATFRQAVVEPSLRQPRGADRLLALLDRWTAYLVDCPFPGGCVLTTASVELDNHPGPLRDMAADVARTWLDFLAEEVAAARPDLTATAAHDLALVVNGVGMSTNQAVQLLHDPGAGARARRGFRAVLGLSSGGSGSGG